jgi:TetR/AcrR family transcriptional regulator, ethionamide resistance regulator
MSPGRSPVGEPRRRRRSPEVAEREILAAAEELLRERPFRDLTVDEVMRRTELSRPSFYVYFRDRNHLVLRVVERLGEEQWALSEGWFEGTGSSGPESFRKALEGVVAVWERHGPVMHALSDAATVDQDVELAHTSLVQTFVDAIARLIEVEIEAGRILPLDAKETARALSLMTDAYLLATLGRTRTATPEKVVETLSTIWTRTLYGA